MHMDYAADKISLIVISGNGEFRFAVTLEKIYGSPNCLSGCLYLYIIYFIIFTLFVSYLSLFYAHDVVTIICLYRRYSCIK